jgi:hypothetical protein
LGKNTAAGNLPKTYPILSAGHCPFIFIAYTTRWYVVHFGTFLAREQVKKARRGIP